MTYQAIDKVQSSCLCVKTQIDYTRYTSISLISLDSKMYAIILGRRMQERSERQLWKVEGGFTTERGDMDQIFSLCMRTQKNS